MFKTVLITGATRGIGYGIAKKLAGLNYRVLGIARQAPSEPFPGELFLADLSSVTETSHILTEIKKKFEVNVVINNVGASSSQEVGEIDIPTFSHLIDINVRTTLQVTQSFLADMKNAKWGRIINMSSLAIHGLKNRSVYAAAKSAVVGLTRTWALELAKYNITVNALAPGAIETDMFRKMRPPGSVAEQEIMSIIPLNKLGKPSDVAAVAALLASDDGDYITGQVIGIDGGASIG